MVQQRSRQESLADEEKKESNKKKKILKELKIKKLDDMSMPPDRRSKEQKIKDFKDSLLAKGGEVKGYMGGGEVEVAMDDSPNSGMITTKGWGKSRAT